VIINKSDINTNLQDIAGGALNEGFAAEIAKVGKNIMDPNYPVDKARKITVTATLKQNKSGLIDLSIDAKHTIPSRNPIESSLMIANNGNGGVNVAEATAGNLTIKPKEEIEAEKEAKTNSVIDFKKGATN